MTSPDAVERRRWRGVHRCAAPRDSGLPACRPSYRAIDGSMPGGRQLRRVLGTYQGDLRRLCGVRASFDGDRLTADSAVPRTSAASNAPTRRPAARQRDCAFHNRATGAASTLRERAAPIRRTATAARQRDAIDAAVSIALRRAGRLAATGRRVGIGGGGARRRCSGWPTASGPGLGEQHGADTCWHHRLDVRRGRPRRPSGQPRDAARSVPQLNHARVPIWLAPPIASRPRRPGASSAGGRDRQRPGDAAQGGRSRGLPRRLATAEGEQHTSFAVGNDCADRVVTRYLVDRTLPRRGARC